MLKTLVNANGADLGGGNTNNLNKLLNLFIKNNRRTCNNAIALAMACEDNGTSFVLIKMKFKDQLK